MIIRQIFIMFIYLLFIVNCPVFAAADGENEQAEPSATEEDKIPCVSHKPVEEPACAAPPLPPVSISGTGGVFATPLAYLVNPAQDGKPLGLPTIGASYVKLREKDFFAATFTETIFGRIELSYAFNNLQLGDLKRDISRATGLDLDYNHVQLHHFNLRANLIPEGAFDQPWLPAITAGAHYKYNSKVDSLNHRLGGALRAIGVRDNDGMDYTLVATKMFQGLLPKPLLLTAGIRWTKACHIGLLGFSDDYKVLGEFSIAQFLTDRLILTGEYKMKPDELDEIRGLVEEEDDWWTVGLIYILNNHMTASLGWFNPGQLLNEHVDNGLACRLVFEF
jgi:hypothetical protein